MLQDLTPRFKTESTFNVSITPSRQPSPALTKSQWVQLVDNSATTGFEASPTADLVYYVRPNPSPVVLNSISFQVRTPWKLGQFSKLTVSFMAENRNDIELGSRVIDSAFVGGCGQKSQQFSFNFGRAQSITPTTVVRLFLNGISESTNGGSPFELRLTSLSPNSQGVTFTLTINGASNIDSIYLSYLVYDSSSFAIPSTDGTFERAAVYNLITQQLANNRINNFNYALYGLSGFEFSSQYAPSFSAKIDNNLLLTVTGLKNVQSYLAVSYILIRGSCSSCSNYPYLSGTNCVQNCPQGFPQNGVCPTAVLPPVCPAFSTYNGSTCVCVQNYFNISGSCQQCPPGTNYNGYQCVQSGGFCPQNSFFNLSTNQCQCSTNFYNISGVCQQCPPGSQWNGYQCSQFGGQCPANANINPLTGRCECIPNYYIINGACQQCGPGTQWNGQYCAPFQPQVNCGANSFFNGSINQCQCNPNYYNISGSCQQCQPGSQWNGQMCAQVNPPNPSGPGISCPYGSNCVLFCSNYLNTVYNPSNNQCVCSSNTFFIQGTCQSCPNGWQFNGFTCIQQNQPICPPNSYRVGSNCVCNDGYIQTPSGCTPGGIVPPPPISCADSMYFDQRNGACVLCSNGCGSCTSSNSCNRCNPGYRLNNRKCSEICGDGIRFVLACDDGNTRNGDGCSRQCKIEPGFSCFGGSPTTPDSCTRERPTSIMIYPTGQTHMSGKVMSNVRVSWLPT